MKQSSLDEQEQLQLAMEMDTPPAECEEDLTDYVNYRPYDDPTLNSSAPGPIGQKYDQRPFSPVAPLRSIVSRLPWSPKVRQKDVDQFLDVSRNKFIGYTLPGDHESLAGLPQPIHEGVKTLRRVILILKFYKKIVLII